MLELLNRRDEAIDYYDYVIRTFDKSNAVVGQARLAYVTLLQRMAAADFEAAR